ncbi:MAG: hypothetical protein KJ607_04200 [Bacteroidetes bacterium]|nr:hypothetical protein [Bacteroidota bacterium]
MMLLNLRYRVVVWRISCPDILARNFEKIRPYRLFSWDEWTGIQDNSFNFWEQEASRYFYRKFCCSGNMGNSGIDLSINMMQMFGQNFEALYLFLKLVRKHKNDSPSAVILPWISEITDPVIIRKLTADLKIIDSRLACFFEILQEAALILVYYLMVIYSFIISLFKERLKIENGMIFWLGISSQEIPSSENSLNFAWAALYGKVNRNDILYFTPVSPDKKQSKYLSEKGVKWVPVFEIFRLIPIGLRLNALIRATIFLLRLIITPTGFIAGIQKTQLLIRASVWNQIVKLAKPRAYVTSTSASWPERPELAVMKKHGIRSIIWAYSANSLQFSVNNPGFTDVGIMRSVILADEFWVWNDAYKKWLEKRQISTDGNRSDIRVVGPIMCGNSEWLHHEPAVSKRVLGLPDKGVCIGVFDMPAVNKVWRDRFGGGPGMIEFDDYDQFCAGIRNLLDNVPNCYALIKMKRYLNDIYRDFPVVLRELIDPEGKYIRTGRVFLADISIDPFLPVGASDIAVGMTYTSPVLAVRSVGRPGWYFDPRKRANYPSHQGLREITVQSAEELVRLVSESVAGEPVKLKSKLVDEVTPPTISIPEL